MALFSCSLNPEEDYPYHKFSISDFDYIPTFYNEIGKITTFRNQYNEDVRFETSLYRIEKKFSNSFNFVGNTGRSSYYDELYINILLLDMEIDEFQNYYCQDIEIKITKKYNGDLLHILSFPNYDGFCFGFVKIFETPQRNTEEVIINDKAYKKVIIFDVGSITFYNNSTIHKVYYDLKHGIIGFDDTENDIQFRIVN